MNCYCCDRPLKKKHYVAFTEDGFKQFIGHECWMKIVAAGRNGWVNPRGGPIMFAEGRS